MCHLYSISELTIRRHTHFSMSPRRMHDHLSSLRIATNCPRICMDDQYLTARHIITCTGMKRLP